MTAMRIIAGRGMATGADILALALRVREQAVLVGLIVTSFRSSHIRESASRYLIVRVRAGHEWTVRVSNHRRPRANGHGAPHLDLISLDGQSGFDQAADWVRRVATGEIEWEPTRPNGRRPRQRRRG